MTREKAKERFLEDIEGHEMEVIHENGVHRHVRFQHPDRRAYWFELITWPGSLCITGDMGTHVFRRTEDMFMFFRMDKNDFNNTDEDGLSINTYYWQEKLQTDSQFGGVREFQIENFYSWLEEKITDHRDDELSELDEDDETYEDQANDCRAKWERIEELVREEVSYHEDDERSLREAIDNLNHDETCNMFQDFWEVTLTSYTTHFIWNLYAIVWGIKQYDKARVANATT